MYQENGNVNSDYMEFVTRKIVTAVRSGFTVKPDDINPLLFEHQRDIVQWALDGGRRAIFAAFGLGKSFMQLETMKHINAREGGRHPTFAPFNSTSWTGSSPGSQTRAILFLTRSADLGLFHIGRFCLDAGAGALN